MAQAAQIIAFPGTSTKPAPAKKRRQRAVTQAEWQNTLLYEVIQLSDHLQKIVAGIDWRIKELKSRHGT